jgi:pyridoxine 5-phosphate synthase
VEAAVRGAKETGADRVELYTEAYAKGYAVNRQQALAPYIRAAEIAAECGLGLNAGHDLDLENLAFFAQNIPHLEEVSIGHALVSDALYYGLENVVNMYKAQLTR